MMALLPPWRYDRGHAQITFNASPRHNGGRNCDSDRGLRLGFAAFHRLDPAFSERAVYGEKAARVDIEVLLLGDRS